MGVPWLTKLLNTCRTYCPHSVREIAYPIEHIPSYELDTFSTPTTAGVGTVATSDFYNNISSWASFGISIFNHKAARGVNTFRASTNT